MLPQRLKSFITRQGYAKYENGQSEPDHHTLGKLVDYFDVKTDYLLGRTNKKESDTSQLTNKFTVAGQEINLTIAELKLFEEL